MNLSNFRAVKDRTPSARENRARRVWHLAVSPKSGAFSLSKRGRALLDIEKVGLKVFTDGEGGLAIATVPNAQADFLRQRYKGGDETQPMNKGNVFSSPEITEFLASQPELAGQRRMALVPQGDIETTNAKTGEAYTATLYQIVPQGAVVDNSDEDYDDDDADDDQIPDEVDDVDDDEVEDGDVDLDGDDSDEDAAPGEEKSDDQFGDF